MFSFFFSKDFYRFLKSGMLLDFIIKKTAYNILYKLYLFSNVIFSEKYFIEYNFLKLEKFTNFLFKVMEFFQKKFSASSISFLIALLIFLLCVTIY
jgi:hypothetical protein